ncbi:hypothetical protein LLE49_07495 [Alicyclobacillus tolerans]|nr:hypothetical protein [Alicyclobacillus tolerans]
MKQNNPKNHMMQSKSVRDQLSKLEKQSTFASNKQKRGSTNEIQPMVTDEGLNP